MKLPDVFWYKMRGVGSMPVSQGRELKYRIFGLYDAPDHKTLLGFRGGK